MEFLDLSKCKSDYYFHPYCSSFKGNFADWDQESTSKVQAALDKVPYEVFDRIVSKRESFPQKIIFVRMKDQLAQAETVQLDGQIVVVLRPQFFIAESVIGGVPERLHTLVHEFFHSVGKDLEYTPFWPQLANILEWRFPRGPNPVSRVNEIRVAIARMNELYTRGTPKDRQEAVRIDRAFSRPRGLPSIYSTVSLTEYFAELGTHLVFEPHLVRTMPRELVMFLLKSPLGFLINIDHLSEVAVLQPRANDFKVAHTGEFVGMFVQEQRPWCTGTMIRHGVILIASHCLESFVKRYSNEPSVGTFFPFYGFEFRRGKETIAYIDGFQMDVSLDPGRNHFAYITYDPSLTQGKVELPPIRMATKSEMAQVPNVFTLGYPLPLKPQRMVVQWSGQCALKLGENLDCPAWFGGSGSPVMSEDPLNPDGLVLWGMLVETFSVSARGIVIPQVRSDSWGEFAKSLWAPLDLQFIPPPGKPVGSPY